MSNSKNNNFSKALNSKVPNGDLESKWTQYKNNINLVSPSNKRKLNIIVVGTGLAGGSAAATLAEESNLSESLSDIKLAAHDEIFHHNQPILSGVDINSLYNHLLSLES